MLAILTLGKLRLIAQPTERWCENVTKVQPLVTRRKERLLSVVSIKTYARHQTRNFLFLFLLFSLSLDVLSARLQVTAHHQFRLENGLILLIITIIIIIIVVV